MICERPYGRSRLASGHLLTCASRSPLWRRRASWQRLKECASLSKPFTELNIGACWRELRGDVRRCAWILCGLSSRILTHAVRRDHIAKRVPEVASQLPNLYVRPRRPTASLQPPARPRPARQAPIYHDLPLSIIPSCHVGHFPYAAFRRRQDQAQLSAPLSTPVTGPGHRLHRHTGPTHTKPVIILS